MFGKFWKTEITKRNNKWKMLHIQYDFIFIYYFKFLWVCACLCVKRRQHKGVEHTWELSFTFDLYICLGVCMSTFTFVSWCHLARWPYTFLQVSQYLCESPWRPQGSLKSEWNSLSSNSNWLLSMWFGYHRFWGKQFPY